MLSTLLALQPRAGGGGGGSGGSQEGAVARIAEGTLARVRRLRAHMRAHLPPAHSDASARG